MTVQRRPGGHGDRASSRRVGPLVSGYRPPGQEGKPGGDADDQPDLLSIAEEVQEEAVHDERGEDGPDDLRVRPPAPSQDQRHQEQTKEHQAYKAQFRRRSR